MSRFAKIVAGIFLLVLAGLPAQADEGFDHFYGALASYLNEFVQDDGLVRYAALALKKDAFHDVIDNLLDVQRKEFESFTPDQKRAYWINLYNALVLDTVIRHYPIKAVEGYSKYPPGSPMTIPGAWNDEKHKTPAGKVTLNRIENNILVETGNPMTVFALCNGTKGSPALSRKPYLAETLEGQLSEAAQRFLRDSRNVSAEADGKKVNFSRHLRVWGPQFQGRYFRQGQYEHREKYEAALINLILDYHNDDRVKNVLRGNVFQWNWQEPNWSLNDVL